MHEGLWDAAARTCCDLIARLAVVQIALEARGLDVTPATVLRFESQGDVRSARVLAHFTDKIRRAAIGARWFVSCCDAASCKPAETWKRLMWKHFPA